MVRIIRRSAALILVGSSSLFAQQSSIASNFNGTAIPAGRTVWFNAALNPSSGAFADGTLLRFINSSIQFSVGGVSTILNTPNFTIAFSSSAVVPTTTYSSTSGWLTTVPTT